MQGKEKKKKKKTRKKGILVKFRRIEGAQQQQQQHLPIKVNQYVRLVAINLLEGQFRIDRPEIQRFAQFSPHTAGFQATRLFRS